MSDYSEMTAKQAAYEDREETRIIEGEVHYTNEDGEAESSRDFFEVTMHPSNLEDSEMVAEVVESSKAFLSRWDETCSFFPYL